MQIRSRNPGLGDPEITDARRRLVIHVQPDAQGVERRRGRARTDPPVSLPALALLHWPASSCPECVASAYNEAWFDGQLAII